MATDDQYVPFSQREGLTPIPPQLELRQVSDELRRLIFYAIDLEICRETDRTYRRYLEGEWERLAQDLHVLHFGRRSSEFRNDANVVKEVLELAVMRRSYGGLFDLIEFLVRHRGCSNELKTDLAAAFRTARAAYRLVDDMILPVGTEQQADAILGALEATEASEERAARKHLMEAGAELNRGDWAGSVRESINAVEAIARKLAPGQSTLGAALDVLDREGYLNGRLKSAFTKLYGYTNDQAGIRHALVFEDEALVDEGDALFMLGACASFVSYLIQRSRAAGIPEAEQGTPPAV